VLKEGGAGFDCASSDEFGRVRGSDIIYANPCKSRQELYKARDEHIKYTTFDTAAELAKICETIPDAKPILRLHVDDKGGARIPLNKKFGIPLKDIQAYHSCKYRIWGFAFHVGSDCTTPIAYQSAFDTVTEAYEVLKTSPTFIPETLDIGGGFSGSSSKDDLLRYMIAPVIKYRVTLLPFERVIAEPGRFFAEEACSLRVPIIGRKTMPDGTEALTVDDSTYGTFSGVAHDDFVPTFTSTLTTPAIRYTIFGRTCDSADCIATNVWLPGTLQEGDVLEVPNIGAYSYASASEFNGFPRPKIEVLN